jgi:DNA polymerase III epsilon subunit-like protein
MSSLLKIKVDIPCTIYCDYECLGEASPESFLKINLRKGKYYFEFKVNDITIHSVDYSIDSNDEDYILRIDLSCMQNDKSETKELDSKITQEDDEKHWVDDDGVIYSENRRKLLRVTEGVRLKRYSILEGTEVICNHAFSRQQEMESITIPNTVKIIGEYAFYDVEKIETVSVPNSVIIIGESAFKYCHKLKRVYLHCQIPVIGNGVFWGCNNLEEINLPPTLKEIGYGAFGGCSSMRSIDLPVTLSCIGNDAFAGCKCLESFYMPDSVEIVGDEAFCRCSALRSIKLSKSIKTIGDKTFMDCHSLESISIPDNVTSIGWLAFSGCKHLEQVNIPNNTTLIKELAFEDCTSLKSIDIPKDTRLGINPFKGCAGLNINCHGEYAFDGTILYNKETGTLISYWGNSCSYTIPKHIKQIGSYSFSNNINLQIVNIIGESHIIEAYAFNHCYSLRSVFITAPITRIEDRAFFYCYLLENIVLPPTLLYLGPCCFFADCDMKELKGICLPDSVSDIEEPSDLLNFEDSPNLTIYVHENEMPKFKLIFKYYHGRLKVSNFSNNIVIFTIDDNYSTFRNRYPYHYEDDKWGICEDYRILNSRFLFFDVETTGLPNDYRLTSDNFEHWPRIVQISWMLTDDNYNLLKKEDFIIKPNGFVIPEIATQIHHITNEDAFQKGIKLETALSIFIRDVFAATHIIGHNVSFDMNVVRAELYRMHVKDIFNGKQTVCTMKASANFCKIPGKTGYKYPTLQELHMKLFGNKFEDAHNAYNDVVATQRCFVELIKKGILLFTKKSNQ